MGVHWEVCIGHLHMTFPYDFSICILDRETAGDNFWGVSLGSVGSGACGVKGNFGACGVLGISAPAA